MTWTDGFEFFGCCLASILIGMLINAARVMLPRRFFPKGYDIRRKERREWRRLIRMYTGKPLTFGPGKGQMRAHLTPHARLARIKRRQKWQRRQQRK